jgi:hypothetical protein
MQGVENSFGSYRQFLLQRKALERTFEYANGEADRIAKEAQELETSVLENIPIVTAAGVALDAAAKLASYFMSNYEIGGIGLTPDTDQLISAVAALLLKGNKTDSVEFPGRRVPQESDFSSLIATIAELTTTTETKASDLSKSAQRAKNDASKAGANKEGPQSAAAAYEQAAALLRKAISKAEEFMAGLAVADAKGVILMTKIAQEMAVCDRPRGDSLALYLDVRAAVGGYYTKKNLWTFLGWMPFYAMGGVVVTYYIVRSDGVLVASGLVPVHSGYGKVSDVQTLMGAETSHKRGSVWNFVCGA